MLILRLLLIFAALSIVLSGAMYFFTRNPRYLSLAWQIVRLVVFLLLGTSKNPDFIPTTALRKKFLAYISNICGAAKFFPRLAFGRTLNF